MKQIFLSLSFSLTVFFLSQSTHADAGKFCELREDPASLQFSLYSSENRLAFANADGEWGIGLCWWMSRFQRALSQVAIFEGGSKHYTDCPLLPFAKLERAFQNILAHRMTKIACFNNVHDFSLAHKNQLVHLLSLWQKRDTYHFQFIRGFKGAPKMSPDTVLKYIEQIYYQVKNKKQITYAMMQTPGLGAHSWLVVKAEKEKGGIVMDVIDSNFPNYLLRVKYTYGQNGISFPRDLVGKIRTGDGANGVYNKEKDPYKQFVLVPMFLEEGRSLERSGRKFCQAK